MTNITLRQAVETWANGMAEDGYTAKSLLQDLTEHGCQSGMVGHLIYYVDTVKFYDEHQAEIDAMLQGLLEDCGLRPDELFGEKWDETDPLARGDMNKNLLAWFGFEEMAQRFLNDMEA